MQLFSADATIFLSFFCPQKVEKTTLKSCSEKLKSTFFSLLPELPKRPSRRIHVPKCGLQTNCIQNWDLSHILAIRVIIARQSYSRPYIQSGKQPNLRAFCQGIECLYANHNVANSFSLNCNCNPISPIILHNVMKRKYYNIGGTCQHSIGKVSFRNTSKYYLETSIN